MSQGKSNNVAEAFAKGEQAQRAGVGVEKNPYSRGTEACRLWSQGWVASHNGAVASGRCYPGHDDRVVYGD